MSCSVSLLTHSFSFIQQYLLGLRQMKQDTHSQALEQNHAYTGSLCSLSTSAKLASYQAPHTHHLIQSSQLPPCLQRNKLRVREYVTLGPSRKQMATEGFLAELNKGTIYRSVERLRETYKGWWGAPTLATVGSRYHL